MNGNDLRKFRRGILDMTQVQLGEHIGKSERSISEWENSPEPIPKVVELAVKGLAQNPLA